MLTITCETIASESELPPHVIYRIEYYLESVRVSGLLSSDLTVCLKEIEHKMRMDMGHMKGKIFTTKRGREL
jgi:hypothetical protein